jgi:hypothetical protein
MSTTARAARPLEAAGPAQLATWMSDVTLRLAAEADRVAIAALADVDDADPPRMPTLVVEQDGHLRAARSLYDGATVADPFARTAHLVRLLETHAQPRPAPPGRLARLRAFIARWEDLWERHPPGAALGTSGQDALRALERDAARRRGAGERRREPDAAG